MEQIKISVIIPVYNVDSYLDECLGSVAEQSFNDFEIIIIDDGSTDDSIKIINDYQNKYSMIKVFRQKNKGLGPARNVGIKHASGDYLFFLDGDDFIEKNTLKTLWDIATEQKADIVKFRHRRVYEDSSPSATVSTVLEKRDVFKNTLSLNYFSVAWDSLYKKSIFIDNNLWFPKMYYEDIAFIFKVLYFASKISVSNEVFYNWRIRKGSITRTLAKSHIKDIFQIYQITYDFLIERNIYKEYETEYILRCFRQYISLVDKIQHHSSLKTTNRYCRLVKNFAQESQFFNADVLEKLSSINKSILLSFKEKEAWVDATLSNPNERVDIIYKLNIDLLREQIQMQNYHEYLSNHFTSQASLSKMQGIYSGKSCVIVGLGPSAHAHDLQKLQSYITFSVSNCFNLFSNFIPTIYLESSFDAIEKHKEKINEIGSRHLFIPSLFNEKIQNENCTFYQQKLDTKVFTGNTSCKAHFSTSFSKGIYKGATVLHECLQVAFCLGFQKVYLLGVDLMYDKQVYSISRDTTVSGVEKIVSEFMVAKEVFENDGRKIYNLSSQSILTMFEYIQPSRLEAT